jgi:hypothetical protein
MNGAPAPIDAQSLKALVESELAGISDGGVLARVRTMLVEPEVILRSWDYGNAGERYPCWTVLRVPPPRGFDIAYCQHGFGPAFPWGMVSADELTLGNDGGWFETLLDILSSSGLLRA